MCFGHLDIRISNLFRVSKLVRLWRIRYSDLYRRQTNSSCFRDRVLWARSFILVGDRIREIPAAIATKVQRQSIQGLQSAGKVHEAAVVSAVNQAK